ncbi:MAG TPA: alpha/beta hydrolase [Microbacterium sp.]|nr:alpha/beta hydrolase [Microbacterium sp.]
MKKLLRVLAMVGIAVAGLVLLSTASNLIMGAIERSSVRPYGETVSLDHGDVNVSVTGDGERTIVLLSGYGTAAPTLDFAPLTKQLEAHYTVVVVERFGYGYADLGVTERTVENVSVELHDTLRELEVDGPILVAHSVAGIYSMDYVNRFPGEVSALVTIDSSVPEDFAVPPGRSSWERLLATTGLVRWMIAFDPAIAAPAAPAGVYSEDETDQIRLMNIWNYANAALIDENNRTAENFRNVASLSYPDDLPVLAFVSQQLVGANQRWLPAHTAQLKNSNRSELVVLDGDHYLHWTHSREMATAMQNFLD